MDASNSADMGFDPKPEVVYRCKKCRRIVAAQENLVTHERGGKKGFTWTKRSGDPSEGEKEQPDCSSLFVEPLKWMQEVVQDGYVGDKLQCVGCNARLGNFNWAGLRCSCGALVVPAFQLHKNRVDECRV